MDMNWQDAALGMAGVIGSCVAVVHGILTQRLMVRPFEEFSLADKRMTAPIRRLVPLLLHFSTISWFLGGLALIAAAIWFEHGRKTRDRPVRWQPLPVWRARKPLGDARPSSWLDAHAAALILIVFGVNKSGG